MDIINIGSQRSVLDEYLIDQAEDVRVQMHRPEFRDVVLTVMLPGKAITAVILCF